MTAPDAPIVAFRGGDAVALEEAARQAVDDLVGDGDRSLVVEELRASDWADDTGEPDITPLANAAQTPPFLTESRVVVARETSSFSNADALRPLLDYLEDPLETTTIVFVWERAVAGQKLAAFPRALTSAIKKVGGTSVDTAPGRKSESWLDAQLKAATVRLDTAAAKTVSDRFGEDASRVVGLLRTLEGAYGARAELSAVDIEPFLGDEGGVAPWDMTDAIDKGDIARSIGLARRMMGGGNRHAVQLLYTLYNHYRNMLALDGADIVDKQGAADLLGIHAYPAQKALAQTRRLGSEGVAEALGLLAEADMDVKGAKGWPPELVIELLVARLAQGARRRR